MLACGGGGTNTTQLTSAPSNLAYPQTTVTGVVGKAITPDIPTVSGNVSSYAVAPALPAGLSVNTSTGAISGTPTATAAQAAYVVTASNASGKTSASLQITVNPAPSSLVYPQATIVGIVGQAITPDIPTVSGTVGSYGITPTLPAGLSLDATTGTISGTPTSAIAQTAYTATATTSSGNNPFVITITVLKAPNTLLELGHAASIQVLRFVGGHVLSADSSGHWVLWDYTSGAMLASGDGTIPFQNCNYWDEVDCPPTPFPARYGNPIDMAGQTFVVTVSNGLEIHDQADGHLISLIDFPGLNLFGPDPYAPWALNQFTNWWQLASDGSYICIGSKSGLFILNLQGQMIVSKPGDYSSALSFSSPGAVHVALGPAGKNVIETILTVDGTSSVSPTFSGQFHSWFVDGGRFLTNESTTVWTYSDIGVQQAVVTLPAVTNLAGEGNWIWIYDTTQAPGYPPVYPLNIYPIGSGTPTLSIDNWASATIAPSGSTLGILSYEIAVEPQRVVLRYQFSVIDLSGSIPVENDYIFPIDYGSAYAAGSSSKWVVGNKYGAILDGRSLASTPRYFGHGIAWSVAGTVGSAAIGTADGAITIIDPDQKTLEEAIDFSSVKLALSADGTVLGAAAYASDDDYLTDRTLKFYSLPSAALISSFPYANPLQNDLTPDLFGFTLSGSGTTIGRVSGVYQNSAWGYTRQVTDITGNSTIWSDTGTSSIANLNTFPWYVNSPLLSPDGTLIAAASGPPATNSATSILRNGVSITAVPGVGVGWIDNDRLLVNQYSLDTTGTIPKFANCAIYSSAGVLLTTSPIPVELKDIQVVTSDSVYDRNSNAIYSLSTGQILWRGSYPILEVLDEELGPVGAVAGPYIVYESGHRIVVETLQNQ